MSENRTNSDAYMLRLPDGLREEIKLASAQFGRSMNAEIVARIQAGDDRKTLRDEFAGQALAAIIGKAPLRDMAWVEADEMAAYLASGAYSYADAMLAARRGNSAPSEAAPTDVRRELVITPREDGVERVVERLKGLQKDVRSRTDGLGKAASYRDAFYEIAAMLGINAKSKLATEAFERDIKPRLQALLAAERGGA